MGFTDYAERGRIVDMLRTGCRDRLESVKQDPRNQSLWGA